jgi:phage baseplate assembly protein W
MANLLDRFKSQVRGSSNRLYDYLPKISQTGDWQRISDINVIINSWNNILLTPRRTYLNDPEYGSDLHKMVFEPADGITAEKIRTEIERSIGTYDTRATIQNIEVFLARDGKGFSVDIDVLYEGEKGILTLTFDENTFNEVLLGT